MTRSSRPPAERLGRREHATRRESITLLPPHVPHDGRGATASGFRKRVVYLEADTLDLGRAGRAVDEPVCPDPGLLREVRLLHEALRHPGDELEAAGSLALVVEHLTQHLGGVSPAGPGDDSALAGRLRELLDAHVVPGISLAAAASELGTHPAALVRSFRRELGIPRTATSPVAASTPRGGCCWPASPRRASPSRSGSTTSHT